MKLIKLANENPSINSYGYLLGIIEGETIEVTNSFPINDIEDESD